MGCAKRGAANGHSPWQAERQSRPPGKPRPIRVAAKCGVCVVALLGFVVPATTFVTRLASIRILPATQSVEDLIRGSLSVLARAVAILPAGRILVVRLETRLGFFVAQRLSAGAAVAVAVLKTFWKTRQIDVRRLRRHGRFLRACREKQHHQYRATLVHL